MSDEWPDNDVLLMLVRESAEHKRAWAMIAGLSKTIISERQNRPDRPSRKLVGEKPETYADRVRHLEMKIIKKKQHLRELEECRAFERETERQLVETLQFIADDRPGRLTAASVIATDALSEYRQRMGPRPVIEG